MAGHLVAPEWALPELLRALRQIFPVAAVVLALLQGLTSEGRQADRRLFCGVLNCKVFARSSCRARKALLFHSFPVYLPEESAKVVPNGALARLTPVHTGGGVGAGGNVGPCVGDTGSTKPKGLQAAAAMRYLYRSQKS